MINHGLTTIVVAALALLAAAGSLYAGPAPAVSEAGQVMLATLKKSAGKSAIAGIAAQPGLMSSRRPPSPAGEAGGTQARLQILDGDGAVLYETAFAYPELLTVPMPEPGSPPDELPAVIPIETPEVTLVTPYFTAAASVRVFDGEEAVPSAFRRLEAGALLSAERTVQPRAPWQQGKFNVLIMASGYTDADMGLFRAAAGNVKANLQTREPFATNISRMSINLFENKADIGCYTGCNNIDRLICCNTAKVVSAAAGSGYFYDEILVIHRTDTYAGGGYRGADYRTNSYNTYCAFYDRTSATVMSLHEFGHSFGNLCDEYSYGSEGYTYSPCVNCRPSCAAFAGHVLVCTPACDAEASYFRPDASVMLDLSHNLYNQASIRASYSPDGLEKILHYFIDLPALSVVKNGSGTGSVVSAPTGIDCGSTCSATFLTGASVTLTATADAGSAFVAWSKAACGGAKDCAVQMNGTSAVTITATFNPPCTYTFSPLTKPFPAAGGAITLAVKTHETYACPAPVFSMPDDWIKAAAASDWRNNRGSVQVVVRRNSDSTARTGSVTIGGTEFDVTQAGALCTITGLTFSPRPLPKAGGTGALTVHVFPKDCTWSAASGYTWIHVPSGEQSGDAALTVTVDANGPKPRIGGLRASLGRPPMTVKAVQVGQLAR